LPRAELLSFEEIARLARLFVEQGVEKIRITGGEPLLRHDLPRLIEVLADIPGVRDLTLTSNGSRLRNMAGVLKGAGLGRLTVSLDAIDDAVFKAMNDVNVPVREVLEGIDAAHQAGLAPIKINMVVKRGVNDHCILEVARYFRHSSHILRFIEYMDVGHSNGWRLEEVVPAREVLATLRGEWALDPIGPNYSGEVATRYRYRDGAGEIGLVASVTQPFCRGCTRARLTADGQLYTCLFATRGHDLRSLLRSGAEDEAVAAFLRAVWHRRTDRYSEMRNRATVDLPKIEMSRVGG
jgi:cyclic pyranopterin phosphate synthase